MKKYIDYVNNFQEWNEYGLFFIENNLQEENSLTQDNIEHILDFVWRNRKKYTWISCDTILKKAEAWNKKLKISGDLFIRQYTAFFSIS